MEKSMILENDVKKAIFQVLSEETSKVRREDFNRLQFKIEELQNSLNETMKELRKLEDCVPNGLKTLCDNRISGISSNLSQSHKLLTQLKDKVRQHKKSLYTQQVEEKKK